MNNEFLQLTLEDLRGALQSLSIALPPNAVLYPIPRGGVIVAQMLEYYRDDIEIYPLRKMLFDERDVIIDDIIDTGKTLKPYWETGVKIMTLWARDAKLAGCDWEPTFVSETIKSEAYFVLPWEDDPQTEKEKYLKCIGKENNE